MPLRSLLESGIPLALGSDGPLNPYLNIMFAVTHPARPSEAITRGQAVEAYTQGSAFAEFEEQEKGTIAEGKLADLAVMSQDIFTVPVNALPATQSILTIVGGKVVLRRRCHRRQKGQTRLAQRNAKITKQRRYSYNVLEPFPSPLANSFYTSNFELKAAPKADWE